jgi:hypothetical protein
MPSSPYLSRSFRSILHGYALQPLVAALVAGLPPDAACGASHAHDRSVQKEWADPGDIRLPTQ